MSHTVTVNLGSSFNGVNVTAEETVVCDGVEAIDIEVAGGVTHGKYEFQCDKDTVKTLTLKSDGGACTIKTNSTSVPDDTIALAAGEIVVFSPNNGSNPFGSANVTALYVTTSTDSTTLKGVVGFDYQP